MVRNMKQKSVATKDFSMVPRADIPRSTFPIRMGRKVPFSASYLVPIFVEEVLPADTWNLNCSIIARTATPIVPIMDNWHIETFFFYCSNRNAWTNWKKFQGEQISPGDSISFTIPQITSPTGGFAVNSLYDYMGLPCVGQVAAGNTISINALPVRMYAQIYNFWFRDENLIPSQNVLLGDGPDTATQYGNMQKRGKRFDYFTGCLPFVQKGTAVSIPLGTQAIVRTNSTDLITSGTNAAWTFRRADNNAQPGATNQYMGLGSGGTIGRGEYGNSATGGAFTGTAGIYPANLYADLSTASAATVNQLRQSFQIQRLLERDARGGTRYKEIIRSHFGVISPDARLDNPEYLGGGHTSVITAAIPQTSATGLTGGTTPAGNLASTGYASGRNGFTYSATEHGYIIGMINARADLTYQQGIRRHWKRSTRYDYYLPVFQALGEQSVFNYEIYADGSASDNLTFGYQERWAEYRHFPSQVVGFFNSTHATPIDYWHSSQKFTTLPLLNQAFIEDATSSVLERNFAAAAQTANQQFLADIMFTGGVTRAMPVYSVPGMIDHF